ncbi:7266_t:CDS:2 [Cetraspora pellucida]|uniref:7266_t:CDS:1 n=1 Tax=Cetraspora pellucida TaxID=1433469 RepID=A0ACA9LGS7_9GLOM|nr:7266_t:CDS:2 [Cetraspora pellucida]
MWLLKQKFALTNNNTINDYMNLIYGPENIDTTDETDNSTDSNIEDSDAKETALLATILDPHLKGLRFVNQDEHINIQEKLRKKYQELKNN